MGIIYVPDPLAAGHAGRVYVKQVLPADLPKTGLQAAAVDGQPELPRRHHLPNLRPQEGKYLSLRRQSLERQF